MNAATNKGAIQTTTTHYIDGAFVESHGREVIDIVRPTDSQIIARVTLADEEDTRCAIAAAKRAFATYGRSTKEERAKILRHLREAASARLDDLTAAVVEEYGGVVQFAGPILQSGVNAFRVGRKGASGDAVDPQLGQDDGDLGVGRSGRPDYRVECERAVHLPKAGLGRCRGVYSCH
jgi:acyl-CoA reductase-like NAD-dependent aldehyde dehydrogenase